MKQHAWMVCASVLFVGGGIAAANNHKFPWCAGISENQGHVTDGGDKFLFNSDADDIANNGSLYDVALASCGNTSSSTTAFDSQLAATRTRWSKRLELGDADWKDVAAYTTLEQSDRQNNGIEQISVTKRTYESLTPLEQFSVVEHGMEAGDGARIKGDAWIADVLGAHLSESGRLAFLEKCIYATDAVEMARCAPDAAAFDGHKVFAEMHADTSANGGGARVEVRLMADNMRREIPKFQARVAALVKKDPAYGKVFELANQTAKQWSAMYAAHDPNVDLALQMDDAFVTNSRKAYEGCAAQTRDAWLKAISAIPAKRFAKIYDDPEGTKYFERQGLPAALQNPDAYLAGFAMLLCAHDAKDETLRALGARIAAASQRWAGNRGPRGAIVSAVTAAEPQFDDRDTELKQPEEYREWMRAGDDHTLGGGIGGIAKVTAKGTKLHIEFVQKEGTEDACAEGSFSHGIEAIRDNGTIQYHYNCKKWKTVKTKTGSPPIDLDASFAGGLKVGMRASIVDGVVDAAWPNMKSDTPVIVFGAAVK